jgi:CBS domain-containing protein
MGTTGRGGGGLAMSTIEILEGSAPDEDAEDDGLQIHGAVLSGPIGRIPRRACLLMDPSCSVAEAVRAMNEHHVGCALVVREGRLVGIFTERDVLVNVAGMTRDVVATKIEHVMTADPDTFTDRVPVALALRKMSLEGYRHIPLVDADRRPIGVVAVRDIVRWMVNLFPQSAFEAFDDPAEREVE